MSGEFGTGRFGTGSFADAEAWGVPVTTAELAAMRATLTETLPLTAVIQRVTRTSDGMGGGSAAWNAAGTAQCRVGPGGTQPEEKLIADRLAGVTAWTVTLPAETDVAAADRIIVGSRTFEVEGVLAPRSWEIGRRVVCREVL